MAIYSILSTFKNSQLPERHHCMPKIQNGVADEPELPEVVIAWVLLQIEFQFQW